MYQDDRVSQIAMFFSCELVGRVVCENYDDSFFFIGKVLIREVYALRDNTVEIFDEG